MENMKRNMNKKISKELYKCNKKLERAKQIWYSFGIRI